MQKQQAISSGVGAPMLCGCLSAKKYVARAELSGGLEAGRSFEVMGWCWVWGAGWEELSVDLYIQRL